MQYDLPFNQYFHACNENQAHEFSEFPQNLVYTLTRLAVFVLILSLHFFGNHFKDQ
jgi:hypothetical protein